MRQNILTPNLIQAVLGIANQASVKITEIYTHYCSLTSQQSQEMWEIKQDKSPLTVADTAANQIIVQALMQLTPSIPVVTEEDSSSWDFRNSAQDFWLIDPLDGSKEFISKNDEFTVNIALVSQGQTVFGVVQAPILNKVYWGGKSMGSFSSVPNQSSTPEVLNASQLNLNQLEEHTCLKIIASKSHMSTETQLLIDRFKNSQLVQAGSSLKFCRVAENQADLYPRLAPTCEWDTAAAQAVLEGAGGVVLQLDGNNLNYGKPNVLNPYFIAGPLSLVQWLQAK